MVNEFLKQKVSEILTQEKKFPLNQALAASYVAAHFKGENIKLFDMSQHSSLCDYSLVLTTQNPTQARSMSDELCSLMRTFDYKIVSFEGYEGADWILVDTGDIIVHIFQLHSRDVYDLDTVFAKFTQVKIPEDFYYSSQTSSIQADTKGYF